jgi:hypothetical protein
MWLLGRTRFAHHQWGCIKRNTDTNDRICCIHIYLYTASLMMAVYWLQHVEGHHRWLIIIIIFQLRTAAFKAHCAILVRHSNFRHQASPRVSPREGTQRRKVELWARNVRKFCLNADLHVTFGDLLHAVKLRHGTDSFTSPPKEGVLRIFSP